MTYILSIPLTLIPLVAYNLFAFNGNGVPDTWATEVFSVDMISGARFTMVTGDVLITGALVALFIEILKATRIGTVSLTDHIFSILAFIVYLVEFLLFDFAATSVFFILMVIALIDGIAGFSITIAGARRDVSFGHSDMH
jgi:hypothetical protein